MSCVFAREADNLLDPSKSADEISRQFQVSIDAAKRRRSDYKDGLKGRSSTPLSSSREVVEKDAGLSASESLVFVSMEYSQEMDRLYSEIFKPTIKSLGLIPLRADEITSTDSIFSDIRRAVDACAVVIAEISGFNPNVMHEIGLAQSIDKPTIIVCRCGYDENQIPSNIRHLRRIMYPNDAGGGPILQRRLEELLSPMCPSR
jgi:hypothetical protein